MRQRHWYWSFFAANSVAGAASPLLPLYVYFLGGGPREVGQLASVASAVGVVASLLWGRLSDRTQRRKPMILVSFGGMAVAYATFPFLSQVNHLLYLNAFVSMVWMASVTVAVLLIMELNSKGDWEREIGRFNTYSGLGWTGGLILGAAWASLMLSLLGEEWGLRSLGAVISALALGATTLAALWVREPPFHISARSFRGMAVTAGTFLHERFRYAPTHLYHLLSPVQLMRFLQGRSALGPDLALWYYGALLAFMGFSMVFVLLPIFLRSVLEWPSELVYALYLIHHGVSVLAFGWARRAVSRWGHRPAVALALLIRATAFVAWAGVGTFLGGWAVPVLFGLAGITWAYFQLASTAVVSRLAPAGLKGQSLGLYNALAGLGNVLGALTGGYLADAFGYQAPFLAGAALVILALPILLVEGRPLAEEGLPATTPPST
ncbi:MAG: MFS transporter [Candidatus Bipolaricaulota bacterium]